MSDLISYFDDITDELMIIGLNLPVNDILNLCLVNIKFKHYLWDNKDFWLSKIILDINSYIEFTSIESDGWRKSYINSFNIWMMDMDSYSHFINESVLNLKQIVKFPVLEIKSSGRHVIAIDLNNNIYVWGRNKHGELGLGDTTNREFPTLLPNIKAKSVACGLHKSFAIDLEDNLLVFGGQNYLCVEQSSTVDIHFKDNIIEPLSSKDIVVPFKVKEALCGWFFIIIRDFNDNIWGMGSNQYGQLGDTKRDYFAPILLTDIKVKQLSTGAHHTFIIDYDDNIWVSGNNPDGRLGLGHIDKVSTFTQIKSIKAKKVICGENSSAIITFENELFMCGLNNNGQLGLGDKINRLVPTKVPNIKVKNVSLGPAHSILLDINSNVSICGLDSMGYKRNLLIPTPLPNIKARNILAVSFSSIIMGYNNMNLY